jgi:hypothetical protein
VDNGNPDNLDIKLPKAKIGTIAITENSIYELQRNPKQKLFKASLISNSVIPIDVKEFNKYKGVLKLSQDNIYYLDQNHQIQQLSYPQFDEKLANAPELNYLTGTKTAEELLSKILKLSPSKWKQLCRVLKVYVAPKYIWSCIHDNLPQTNEFIELLATLKKNPNEFRFFDNKDINITNRKIIKTHNVSVKEAFSNIVSKTTTINLRQNQHTITYASLVEVVKSHGIKYKIVAMKYDQETDYRYLIALDSTWMDIDIIKAYALRWLVEVFIQDWKNNEGWNNLAKQRNEDGSVKGVTLSLLCDHLFILHPAQMALAKTKSPALTVGSLRQKIIIDSLMSFIKNIVNSENPKSEFAKYSQQMTELFAGMPSKKHMRTLDFEEFGPEKKVA